MARPAPAVRRVSAILRFLADRPDESFSLSEIARAADLSAATAHAMLQGAADEGLLLRDPRSKKYSLGPLLVRLGEAAASRRDDVVTLARDELRRVASSLGRQATLTRVVGNHILVVAKEGDPGPWGMGVQIGQRLPMTPPLGSIFVAWSSRAVVERWLQSVDGNPSALALQRCTEALSFVRSRGYAVSLNLSDTHRGLMPGAGERLDPGLDELLVSSYFVNEVDDDQPYALRQLAAPVFDSACEVTVALSINYLGDSRTGREISQDAEALLEAAGRVTIAVHGTAPAPAQHAALGRKDAP
jgi:DNA-binding IclR family transcriptional regulator